VQANHVSHLLRGSRLVIRTLLRLSAGPNILRIAVTHLTKQYAGNIVCKLTGTYVSTVRMFEVFTRLAEIVVMSFIYRVNTGRYEGHFLFNYEVDL